MKRNLVERLSLPLFVSLFSIFAIPLGSSPAVGEPEGKAVQDKEKDTDADDQPEDISRKMGGYRHTGFMLRLATGPGFSWDDLDAYGLAYETNVKVGYSLRENLAVSLEFDFAFNAVGHSGLHPNYFLGLSIDYYFMPYNFYLSASLGYDQVWIGRLDDSRYGLAGIVAIGKEWWVSEEWGLGLEARNAFIGAVQGVDHFCYLVGFMVSATYY